MNTDETHNVSWEINQLMSAVHADLPLLKNAANTLETKAATDTQLLSLINELRAILDAFTEVTTNGDNLSLRLSKEAARWETADQDGASTFTGVCAVLGPIDQSQLVAFAPKTPVTPAPSPTAQPAEQTAPATAPTEAATAVAHPAAAEVTPALHPAPVILHESLWSRRVNELASINQEIRELESQSRSNLSVAEARRLEELYDQRSQLDGLMRDGVTVGKPGPNNFPEGQCTWYVASRREIGPLHGDARLWNSVASDTGYDVGDVPIKGSIMVWQPGVHNADQNYGHVSFVERVIPNRDGTFTVEFTDNLNMNPDNPTRIVITPGEEGVSFIYDRVGA
ncbi:MAG: CHAP domain-containing protein [Ardenticatenaceae bacterium]|nr:CHAP domain-containing protein [Ardenticatenaceae bacterium]